VVVVKVDRMVKEANREQAFVDVGVLDVLPRWLGKRYFAAFAQPFLDYDVLLPDLTPLWLRQGPVIYGQVHDSCLL